MNCFLHRSTLLGCILLIVISSSVWAQEAASDTAEAPSGLSDKASDSIPSTPEAKAESSETSESATKVEKLENSALSVNDIITQHQQHVVPDRIIDAIRARGLAQNIGMNELMRLHKAGVPDQVIRAAQIAQRRSPENGPLNRVGTQEGQQTLWRFTLMDGTLLTGRVRKESNGKIVIVLVNGESRMILRDDVVKQAKYRRKPVKVVHGKIWEENPNRTRHLWSPSAMPLRKGEGYISQKELLFSSYAVGLTDNIAVLLGSFLPGLLAGGDGFNLIGALKIADEVADKFYIGGGGEMIFIPTQGVAAGVPFVSFTYGEPDVQMSLNVGKPFSLDRQGTDPGELLVSISGMWRFKGNFALVSENIFIPAISSSGGWGMFSLNGLAFRSIRDETAWDLGVIMVESVPIPWFDYTWYIGD